MSIKDEDMMRFLRLPGGNICDSNGKGGNMDPQIKPIDPKSHMVGRAFTVRCHPGDNLPIHRAIAAAPEGSVLVVDAHGYCGGGHFGEIMALACRARNLAGLVIDGSCRDADDIEEVGFPVFCRALNPGGTVKETLGQLNIPIDCGGLIVNPGDIVFGDRDGVIVIPQEKAEEVLVKAEALAAKEVEVKAMIQQGKTTIEIYGFEKLRTK